MAMRATGTFEVSTWDEKPYEEMQGGAKLSRARVTQTFRGDIEGTGTVEYLMMYPDENYSSFIGLQRVVGRIGDKSGSFVLQVIGTFADGVLNATWSVLPRSATEELRGLRGEGDFSAVVGRTAILTLNYDFGERP